jgi:hypothetical protein
LVVFRDEDSDVISVASSLIVAISHCLIRVPIISITPVFTKVNFHFSCCSVIQNFLCELVCSPCIQEVTPQI